MKSYKLLLLSSALALGVGAFGTDVSAEEWYESGGDLHVFVDKDKDVYVDLDIDKYKDVYIDVDTELYLDAAAEADSLTYQKNYGNWVATSDQDTTGAPGGGVFNAGDGIAIRALVTDSIYNNSGIVQVNQDVGYMVNQGNVLAIAITNTTTETAFANAEASAEQINEFNWVEYEGGLGVGTLTEDAVIVRPDRSARIYNSINSNSGIVQANQNAGAMNNQLNELSLAIADEGAVVALAESDLGQLNAYNHVKETNTVKRDLIENSINYNSGVVMVNQSTGNMNNQGAVVSFAGLATIQ